ncbi:anthranilate synthase component I family protein [Thermoproteota archaeon]
MKSIPITWSDPIHYAKAVQNQFHGDYVFYYSSMYAGFSGRYSYLAFKPDAQISSNSHAWADLANAVTQDQPCFDNAWFGYLGYGLRHGIEYLPKDTPSFIHIPDLWMNRFQIILVFDHKNETCAAWVKEDKDINDIPDIVSNSENSWMDFDLSAEHSLHSNMSKQTYLEHVNTILDAINRGDIYQANLTRKFYGTFKLKKPEDIAFTIFLKLCSVSPAPYSSILRLGNYTIVSSSPEQFIRIDKDGHAESRPIKGSAPRFSDPVKDSESRRSLKNSKKDQAENLMIVDLMRNDFSKSSIKGSVSVPSLFEITSYSTIHHMSSTISGQKQPEISSVDFIKNAFPPGSMTGTPKIRAMEICSELENQERGVYSGAIGWFGGDGSADFSVVIRTLILEDNKFEFQVGGAIVADSIPEKEWDETMVKAKGIALALGIDLEILKAL